MHYGAPPNSSSGTTTPGSEWNSGRRLSDPLDGVNNATNHGNWSAGPFGDGAIYGDPESEGMDPLPSTSFGDEGSEAGDELSRSRSTGRRQRKSKSYANMADYERGRRRESSGHYHRRSRASGETDAFVFAGQQSDPAGRDSLRQSRTFGNTGLAASAETGGSRRDSHFATTLPSRSFGHRGARAQSSNNDPVSDMPLDSEIPTSPSHSPQRQSIGPEDEELYAGQSLALYAFEPENPNELRLKEGQIIMVSYRHGQGWLVAEDPETGEHGLVPEAYVRLLSELPHYDPETGNFIEVEEDGVTEDVMEEEQQQGDSKENASEATKPAKETRIDEAYEEAENESLEIRTDRTTDEEGDDGER